MIDSKIYTVNKKGLQEIKKFLEENHRYGLDLDEGMLQAWANDAESQLADGNLAEIEISALYSKEGVSVTYCISDAGLDCSIIHPTHYQKLPSDPKL